jgi:hypothetical protein
MSKIDLEHTEIYRGGATASNLGLETQQCAFEVATWAKAMDFHFHMASKGGGTTEVLLRIGAADLPEILQSIAINLPELDAILSECAAIAVKKRDESVSLQAKRLKFCVEKLEEFYESVEKKRTEPEDDLLDDTESEFYPVESTLASLNSILKDISK